MTDSSTTSQLDRVCRKASATPFGVEKSTTSHHVRKETGKRSCIHDRQIRHQHVGDGMSGACFGQSVAIGENCVRGRFTRSDMLPNVASCAPGLDVRKFSLSEFRCLKSPSIRLGMASWPPGLGLNLFIASSLFFVLRSYQSSSSITPAKQREPSAIHGSYAFDQQSNRDSRFDLLNPSHSSPGKWQINSITSPGSGRKISN
jgi:hypothetical protein